MNPYKSPEFTEPAKCPRCPHCNPELVKPDFGERFLNICFCVTVAFWVPAAVIIIIEAIATFAQKATP